MYLMLLSTLYNGLGSESNSGLWSDVPHSNANSADLRFQDSKYSVAQITLKKANITKPISSRNSSFPQKKT